MYHTPKAGRDKVFKSLVNLLELYLNKPAVGVMLVDYETGTYRQLIEEYLPRCERRGLSIFPNVEVRFGHTPRQRKLLIGVVFDPRIEEAFVCRLEPSYCNDRNMQRTLKSDEGRKLVRTLVENQESARQLVSELVDLILDIVLRHLRS